MASSQSLLVLLLVLMFDVTHLLFLQVLYESRALCENTVQLLSLLLASVIKEHLATETEFWISNKTLITVAERSYFSMQFSGVNCPQGLRMFLSEGRAFVVYSAV